MTDSQYCGCGAQWHGDEQLLRAAAIIAAHRARARDARDPTGCHVLSHHDYARLFRCLCAVCQTERLVRRRLTRGAR
jgi:hypothetical protein